jgi:demethylspheroidene O-methyltransferase
MIAVSNFRNRLYASARFRRWASRFPLTRGVARGHARGLFDLVAGFVYSQVTYAMVTTGTIARLGAGAASLDDLARGADLPEDGMLRLIKAAASLGLAEATGDRWMLGPAGAALAGDAGVQAMIVHHAALYRDLADPVALLRSGGGGGALSGYWPYAEGAEGEVAGYSALMAASQPMVAEQVIGAYDFGKHKRLLDIGGGAGAFVAAVSAAHPRLETALFDLPDVAALAVARMPGLATFGGSFLRDPLPTGFDCLTLIRIVHDHDDAAVMTLLRAARAALTPGGRLVIGEPMAERGSDARVGDAYFGMYLLAMGSGRARSRRELRDMLRAAGFASARARRTALPLVASVIVAG